MRTGIITAAVMTALGLAGAASTAQAREDDHHDGRTEVREVRQTRPVEVRRVEHVDRVVRDVHVDRPVVVERDVHRWDHGRVYIPTPVVTVGVPCVTAAVPCVPAPVVGYFDTPIGVDQIPPVVMNNAAAQSGGAPIVSADYVHNAVGTFYDVHVAGPYNTIRTLRFGLNGGFYGFI